MIGSETFIIVAFRCRESSTPSRLAASICAEKNARNAATFMTEASITSPGCSASPSLSGVTWPSPATNSMRAVVAASSVTDFSLSKKSPWSMWATRALEPRSGHACIILCGCF